MELAFQTHGGRIRRTFDRCAAKTVQALGEFPTGILSDCQERMGAFCAEIRPVGRHCQFAGSVFTIEEAEGGNLMSHLALQYVQAGDVLVINAKGVTSRACWGGLQTAAAKNRGIAAIVIDGAIRDVEDVRNNDVPVFCRGVTPAGPLKGWGGLINYPTSCGGQAVKPGDVLVGDADGVVVIPRERTEIVLQQAEQRRKKELIWFERVAQGEVPADFLGLTEKVKQFRMELE